MPAGCISPGRAEECPREDARRAPFADPLHPTEQECVGKSLRCGKRAQPSDDLRMPADVRPVMRKCLAFFLYGCGRQYFFRPRHHI